MDIDEATRLSQDLKVFGKTLRDSAKIVSDTLLVTRSIKRLAGCPKSSDLSSRLIKAGLACIVFPEPLFSDIIGCALVVVGTLAKSRRGSVVNVFKETGRIVADLRKIYMEL